MFCPECGLDYAAGPRYCPDCDVTLVTEPEESAEPGEFVPLVEVTEAAAFVRAMSRLEEEGIPWFVQSEPSRGMAVAMLYVAESWLERARRALDVASLVAVAESG